MVNKDLNKIVIPTNQRMSNYPSRR